MRAWVLAPMAIALALAAVGSLLLSVVTIVREREVLVTSQLLSRGIATLDRGGYARTAEARVEPDSQARVLLAHALLQSRAASAQPIGQIRTGMLNDARKAATAAGGIRPGWGETDLVLAYVASLENINSAVILHLSRSYRNAPFLIDAASWRVREGLVSWDQLDQATKTRVVKEAVMIARLKSDLREPIFDLARASDAYVSLSVEWHRLRLRDADRPTASYRATP